MRQENLDNIEDLKSSGTTKKISPSIDIKQEKNMQLVVKLERLDLRKIQKTPKQEKNPQLVVNLERLNLSNFQKQIFTSSVNTEKPIELTLNNRKSRNLEKIISSLALKREDNEVTASSQVAQTSTYKVLRKINRKISTQSRKMTRTETIFFRDRSHDLSRFLSDYAVSMTTMMCE
ncbi:hypothetical protein Zmor_002559 [Zophobas morio]|uniref:Uncharacterized protein n=1 Tax=Zophobas morio TaxID=2755281 RepID=A0AA38J153_9CUCU|nr:hypothetical protein Zmor_002559 [Zophobas morio]